ncbi:MAG: M12 family metallopeptidase [Chloroflexi bacterium]|nr:M12 family metallopeptidase [Chloroflexota bacterium]
MPRQRIIRVCIDRWLPGEEPFSPSVGVGFDKGALQVQEKWEPAQTLKVRFLGGAPDVCVKIMAHAQEWSGYANLKFDFGNHLDAEIRISFEPGGSWSYIGKDALGVASDSPTMNLGWLGPWTSDDEIHRVVLHEFGHAIGMIHEHQNPDAKIKWNKEAVYKYYEGYPNYWSRAEVDHNLFKVYSANPAITQFTAFDKNSIMVYPIPKEHTLDGFSVGWNSTLSSTDKAFIAEWYPF